MGSPSSSGSSAMHLPAGGPCPSTPASSPPLHEMATTDTRQKTVQKVLDRSHAASVARGLRSRLSYASYKAVHNVPNATLLELEKQSPASNSASYSRPKRKAPGGNTSYNVPAPQGGQSSLPPQAKKTHYPQASSTAAGRANGSADGVNGLGPGHSLFSTILAPPPTAHARTILNAEDPPVNAPARPPPSPRASKGPVRSIVEGTRSASRGRQEGSKSPDKNKNTRKGDGKGKQKESARSRRSARDGDVDDMAAAATLTSLLMHRPSMTSDAGSDGGSVRSYQYAQSSTRQSAGDGPRKARRISSQSPRPSKYGEDLEPPIDVPDRQGTITPRPPPTDNEAADLMLFLATSPSPARKSRNERDEAAFRALGGGLSASGSRPGRVLFPSASEGAGLAGRLPNTSPQRSSGLARHAHGYTSSVSSIGSEVDPRPAPPRVISHSNPLMPSVSVPTSRSAPSSPGHRDKADLFTHHDPAGNPQPNRPPHAGGGLRMDVARKLFEEQQQQQHRPAPPRRIQPDDGGRNLGPPAGIHH